MLLLSFVQQQLEQQLERCAGRYVTTRKQLMHHHDHDHHYRHHHRPCLLSCGRNVAVSTLLSWYATAERLTDLAALLVVKADHHDVEDRPPWLVHVLRLHTVQSGLPLVGLENSTKGGAV